MYNGIKVLDIHGHVSAPGAAREFVANLLASNTASASPLRTGKAGPGLSDDAFRVSGKRHIDLLDDHNIDVQVIGPRPYIMLGWMQPHLIPAWCGFVNDTIAKQVELYPDRLLGAAQLPQNAKAPDLAHCLPELERCHKDLGFVAAYLSPDPTGHRDSPGMHEPYWYPVYEYCQREKLPIIIHGTTCQDPRIGIIPQNYQIGFVVEQFIATQLLSHSDVFQRFPELKIVVCHCGGALDRFIPTDPHLGQTDISNNLFFDTNALDLHFLEAAIKQRTPNRMLFGTETPGSGSAIRPETGRPGDDLVPIIGAFPFLSEEDKKKIFHDNALRICPGLAKFA